MNPKIYSNINNYLIIYTPKVIPWGQMDKQTNKQMDGRTDGRTNINSLRMSYQTNYSKQKYFVNVLSQFGDHVLQNTCWKFGVLLLLSAYVYDPTCIGPQYNKKPIW
jgi:hypothetical protein